VDRFCGTNVCTGSAIGAYFRIDLIDIAFGNSFYRTFIDAGSASDAIIIDNISHDTIEFNE
jgi:hypothetical protein